MFIVRSGWRLAHCYDSAMIMFLQTPDLNFTIEAEMIFQFCAAVLIGGVAGIEPEVRDKPAGFRTNICICLGTTIFTMLSSLMAEGHDDSTRIAAGILGGIGFLGAGTIMRQNSRVQA